MSTPATLPAQHGYHGYSHHGNYTSKPGYQSPSDPATARGPPMAPTSSYSNYTLTASQNPTNPSKQLPPLNAVAPTPSSLMSSKPSNQHRPDWNEFYKNGPPKEIIVIDDDSPPPQPSQPSQAVQKAPIKREYMASRNAKQELVEHTNKKRRTGHIYDNVPSHHQPSYSHDNTRQSGSDTISTDRTTSLHNTAPTSLGSNGSGSGGGYIEPASIGQKRKRAVRQIAEDKKRKEIATAAGDLPYSSYIPPPRPPIKAKEVQVVAIKDVSYLSFKASPCTLIRVQSQPNHSKCDDEDGHFIVQENSEMADRCKSCFCHCTTMLTSQQIK
jgi:dual-specificity kinase